MNTNDKFFVFDYNRRVYEKDGVKSSSPIYREHFREIKVTGETDREYLCSYGTINKRTMRFKWGKETQRVYTEQEMEADVFVNENRHKAAERVRSLSAENADKLKAIIEILDSI